MGPTKPRGTSKGELFDLDESPRDARLYRVSKLHRGAALPLRKACLMVYLGQVKRSKKLLSNKAY